MKDFRPEKLEIPCYLSDEHFKHDHEKITNHFFHHVNKKYTDTYNPTLDFLIGEGLSKKGFWFDSQLGFELFIKERCKCLDSIETSTYTFLVDDIPFLSYCYANKLDIEKSDNNGNLTFTGIAGKYKFL